MKKQVVGWKGPTDRCSQSDGYMDEEGRKEKGRDKLRVVEQGKVKM